MLCSVLCTFDDRMIVGCWGFPVGGDPLSCRIAGMQDLVSVWRPAWKLQHCVVRLQRNIVVGIICEETWWAIIQSSVCSLVEPVTDHCRASIV